MNEQKHRCVRRRTRNQGSEAHPRKLTIRMTEQLSNRVASIQGLIYKYGKRETMADIFETVLFPVLRSYVAPYVERAKADRESQKEGVAE
jgi:hypothetical protein